MVFAIPDIDREEDKKFRMDAFIKILKLLFTKLSCIAKLELVHAHVCGQHKSVIK